MRTSTRDEQGGRAVDAWRRDQLVAAGFPLPTARRLARDHRYELHALLDLVERGCPPVLARRIVAPLDEADAA
jgi:hypothetical protein